MEGRVRIAGRNEIGGKSGEVRMEQATLSVWAALGGVHTVDFPEEEKRGEGDGRK